MDNTSKIKPHSLRLGYYNANGILGQRDEISAFLQSHKIDILLVQETFLKPRVRGPNIANYKLIRNDRITRHKGGTLIYYKRSLHCVEITPPDLSCIEASICRLAMSQHQSITLVSAYCPPTSSSFQSYDPILFTNDLRALLGLSDSVIIAGDLNAKHPAWNSNTTSPRGRLLFNQCESLNFDVIAPMHPTHFPNIVDHLPDVLDVALLKNVNFRLHSIEVLHELTSDHRPVLVELASRSGPLDPDRPPPPQIVTDWRMLSESLKSSSAQLESIPDEINSVADMTGAIGSFTEHVQSTVDKCSRRVEATSFHRFKLPDDVRALVTEKNAAVRAYSTFPCDANKSHMRNLQRAVKERLAEMRQTRWDKTLSELEPTHQAFWQLQRKLKSDEVASTPPIKRPDNSIAFEDDEKAECLADSLEAQCSPSTQPVDPAHLLKVEAEVERRSSLPPQEDPDDPLPPVTPDEVAEIIKRLKPRKAPGPDRITNKVFKILPASLVMLMTAIFNCAMTHNLFPQAWKEATVIGIPKPGKPKSDPSSYRPISLLNVFGKIYEILIYKRLKDYVEAKSLIPLEQFGFRTHHSCVQQVHRIVEGVSHGFQRGQLTGTILFDIAKAFDKVWHKGLIYKLYQLGVPDRLVVILRDFLSNRTFRYRIDGTLSSAHPIKAGVPQGSVLSPILFTLYTSDIPKNKHVQLALFADDTAIYCSGRSPAAIVRHLQAYCNTLGVWTRLWRIELHPDKSQAILFSSPRRRLPPAPPSVTMFGRPIPWKEHAKYLGVILDQRLSFAEHIRKVRSRAAFVYGRLHFLLNSKSKLSLKSKLRLYGSCIRPVMMYACPVFAQASHRRLHRMQALQNRALRKITGAPYYVRNEILHVDLKIPTIRQYMKRAAIRYFERAEKHDNSLIVSASNYTPSRISRIRRPRHALLEPDDEITVLQESSKLTSTLYKHKPRSYKPRRRGPPRRPVLCPPDPCSSSQPAS